MNLTCPERSF